MSPRPYALGFTCADDRQRRVRRRAGRQGDAGPRIPFQRAGRGVAGAGRQHRRGRAVLGAVCQGTVA